MQSSPSRSSPVGRHDVDDVAAALERVQGLVVVAARQAGLGRRDVARRALDRHRHGVARHDAAEDRLLLEREVAVVEDRADAPRPEPIADRHPRRAGLIPGGLFPSHMPSLHGHPSRARARILCCIYPDVQMRKRANT